ncbi:CBU_0592 family membrane protein [Pseudarthrobacter scleromae]|uniref:CBU_0592 family membrane protein n=1 Tax=Pseudarthrobacter scleromae TaxID=158897 RepID=UPI003D086CB9
MDLLWETTGWLGAVAILGAYLAVSMGWLKTERRFQTANLLGACAFIINGIFHEAWPSVVTNIAWFLISTVALFRMRSTEHSMNSAIDNSHVQFPGTLDTTGQLAVIEVLTRNVPGDIDGQGPGK